MRKIVAFAMAVFMVIALASCGQSEGSAESSRDSSKINVMIEADKHMQDGQAHFVIKTNLPDETELILTLSQKERNFTAQSKVTIENGEATSEAFTDDGNPLEGDYLLDVSMSLPNLQSERVQSVIGENGENLTGKFVNEENGTVRAEFECSFDQDEQKETASSQDANTQVGTSAVEKAESATDSVAVAAAKNESTATPQSSAASKQDTDSTKQTPAVRKAEQYLSFSAFSHDSLVAQLEFEGFSTEDSVYAADHCGANWTEQALKKAKEYLKSSSFSYSGLINQLEFEKFSHDDAVYGADNCGADWNEQAAKKATDYRRTNSFSHQGLVEQLEFEGFTSEQAEYGASATE